MKPVLAVLLLAALGAVAYTQTPPPPAEGPLLPSPVPPVPAKPAPKEPTVEELLNELEKVQAQKAALEKREKELAEAARKKLEQQGERLKRLGLKPTAPQGAGEPVIGEVLVSGAGAKEVEKIKAAARLKTGEPFSEHELIAARVRLDAAGYRSAEFKRAYRPNADPGVADIIIEVTKPE